MAKVKFLAGPQILREVRRLMAKDDEAIVAVAFWGNGGGSKSRILERKGKKTRILCDLFSGACNPDEMRLILKANASLRTIDGMHAKVWCVGDEAVVGSANASTNGLGMEGSELSGNVEAAILINDAPAVSEIRAWFETQWASVEASRVTSTAIADVAELWKARRKGPERFRTASLIEALREPKNAGLFKNVRILAYDEEELSDEGEAKWESEGKKLYTDAELDELDDEMPYEDHTGWEGKAGDILVDVRLGARNSMHFSGMWRVRQNPTYIPVPYLTIRTIG